MIRSLPLAGEHRRFLYYDAAKLDYGAIAAYVAEGQAELCEFPVGGLHPEVLKFMPMGFQPELKRELRQFAWPSPLWAEDDPLRTIRTGKPALG